MNDQKKVATKVKEGGRTLTGKVVSAKMDKTVVVLVTRKVKHPLYKKYVNRSTKIHAHSPDNAFEVGDLVVITESRPISKLKRWKVLKKA